MTSYVYMIVAGIFVAVSLSSPDLFFLSWIAFIPVIAGLKDKGLKQSFFNGLVLGIVIMLGSTYWVYYPLVDFSGLPLIVIIIILALLYTIMGSFYGLWAFLFVYINGKREIHPFLFAFSWVAVEFLRYKLIPVYPLGFIAYTQTNFKSLIQLADVGGMFLISLIVLFINCYIYKLLKRRKLRFIIPLFIIVTVILSYGMYRLNYYDNKQYKKVSTTIVNTMVSQKYKWKNSWIEKNIDEFIKGAKKYKDVSLIIGPETSLTFDIIRNEYYRDKFIKKLDGINSYIQVGTQSIMKNEKGKYNSVFLLSPQGEIIDRYNKRKLVPFGEFIPFYNTMNILKKFPVNSLNEGKELKIFKTTFASWGTSICSELFYPLIYSDSIDFLINHSNEAWFRESNLHQQMWSAAVYRAVEYRSSVVRAGNYSWSGMIEPSGKYNKVYKKGQDIKLKIKINNESTFYQHWKNYIGWGAIIIVILSLLIKKYVASSYSDKF